MIVTVTGVHDALRSDFDLACIDLTEARRRLADEATSDNPGTVPEARARIDGILDMYLAASCPAGTPVAAAECPG